MKPLGKSAGNCLALGWVLAALSSPLAADEIYRWVDDAGVVHFSDQPPAARTDGLSTVEIEAPASRAHDPEADIFNIEATAARTQARREQLQEQRELRLEQARSRSRSAPQYPEQPTGYSYGYPWGYPAGGRPPRPERPPRPQPPPRPEPAPDDTSTLRPPGQSAPSERGAGFSGPGG